MKIHTALAAGLLLLLPAQGYAADFQGVFELDGRYSNRRKTSATLIVTRSSDGRYLVTRRGKYTSRRYASTPEFIWQSTDVTVDGSRMTVVYSLEEADAGLIGRLAASSSTARVVDALERGNQLKAVYFLKDAGKQVREVVVNRTRNSPQEFWRYLVSNGKRKISPQPGGGSGGAQSAFVQKAFAAINAEVQKAVEDHYDFVLDFADTPDEEADALASRKEDRKIRYSRLEQVNPDEVMDDSLDWRYGAGNDPLEDAAGEVVPRDALEVWQIELAGELTDFESLSWTFVFDKRTGELLISDRPDDLH